MKLVSHRVLRDGETLARNLCRFKRMSRDLGVSGSSLSRRVSRILLNVNVYEVVTRAARTIHLHADPDPGP